jgi:predicted small integral membrane protein
MSSKLGRFSFLLRLDQIGVALIPAIIGILALINDVTSFTDTVNSVVKPLITLQNNGSHQLWRALPASVADTAYVAMFVSEFIMGLLALVGIILMIKNIRGSVEAFEKAKNWIYLACGWGIIVWGLGFFEIGGDWFLAWQNNDLASFQQGSLNYVLEIFVAFVYLKLIRQ